MTAMTNSADKLKLKPQLQNVFLLLAAYACLRAIIPFLSLPLTTAWFVQTLLISPLFLCINFIMIAKIIILPWKPLYALLAVLICAALFVPATTANTKDIKRLDDFRIEVNKAQINAYYNKYFASQLLRYAPALPAETFWLNGFTLQTASHYLPPPPNVNQVQMLIMDTLSKILLLLMLTAGGVLLSFIVGDLNLLVPIVPVTAAVDIISVFHPYGPASQALNKFPELVSAVSSTIPQIGLAGTSVAPIGQPFALIGPGDILFASLFLAILFRFGAELRRTVIALCIALSFYLEVVLNFGNATFLGVSLQALPALVPMSLVILFVNLRRFKLSFSEVVMSGFIYLLCIGVVVAAFSFR